MEREPKPPETANNSKMKIWIWSAIALLITNLVVAGIVAFLIHKDSVQENPSQSPNEKSNYSHAS
ncbi:MAG: hypothetical protein KME23_16885 [Goleter apudmare HA4340-LM2]|nr:hypothetical protein [Goleter apudmare HA4340-LM2]